MKEYNKPRQSLLPGFYGDDRLTMVRIPRRGLSSQSLSK